MNKFIIFATARTGSTSLARVLEESSDVKMAIEPFHDGFSRWNAGEKDYSNFIVDSETMNEALDDLFSRYTAIKVLDYQLEPEIYYSMFKRKDFKILFLRRKNIAQSVLSNLVAEQTAEWHKQGNTEIYKNLKPINLDKMSEMIEYIISLNSDNAKFLEENRKGDYLPLYYEELYSDSLEQNTTNLKVICDFLDISVPPDEAIKKYMLPSEAKINYLDIYKNVPNYEDIKMKFGKL